MEEKVITNDEYLIGAMMRAINDLLTFFVLNL